jgi:hypothetical protein
MNTLPQSEQISLQRRAILGETQFLAQIAEQSQFAATLQTHFRTRNIGARRMEQYKQQATASLHKLRLRFNRATTGNGWLRKPNLTPIFVPSLEGTLNNYDRHKTLHFHIVIGNLSARYDTELLHSTLRDAWLRTDAGVDDIVVTELDSTRRAGWTSYIGKERERGNKDCIDYYNAQLPPYLCTTAQQFSANSTGQVQL